MIFQSYLLAATLAVGLLFDAAAAQPNFLILLADDLGYEDVGYTGGKVIKTPNLDKLAQSGAILEQYYVQPLCSPTRAALMTGRYPMRLGMQVGVIKPWEKRGLPLEERLLPQVLKEAGYTTAIVGKWHLGLHAQEYLPTRRGFDQQYGHYCGAIDYFKHDREGGFDWHRNDKRCDDEGYSTHLLAREAVRLIQGYSSSKPFFLYVPFNAVHSPLQVPPEYKAAYSELPEPRRTYAGMVAAMDEAVGQIYAALKQRGFATNTLIVFSSDNGGPAPGKITDNGSLRGAKGGVYEGGARVCAFANWEGHIQPGTRVAAPLHVVDWFPTMTQLANVTGTQKSSLDGKDILPVIAKGATPKARDILINATPAGGAIRSGDWKLVVRGGQEIDDPDAAVMPKRKQRARATAPLKAELFNLAQDRSEKNDLADKHPEKVKELRKRYEALARQAVPPANQPQPAQYKAPAVWGETAASE